MYFDQNPNPMPLIPYQTKLHETNLMDFDQIQTKIHQINPMDLDQNRNRKRYRDDDDHDHDHEEEEEEDDDIVDNLSTDPSIRYPAAAYDPGSLPNWRVKEGIYEKYKTSVGDCASEYRLCPEFVHEVSWIQFGYPSLEVYKIKIVIRDPAEAKRIYKVDFSNSSSSRLYGAIKICRPEGPGWEQDGEFLYKVEKDNAESIKFIRKKCEITLHPKYPFTLLMNAAIMVALKLNDVDLLKIVDESDNDCRPYQFGDEKIACGRFYFDVRTSSRFRRSTGSFVQSRSVWGSYVFGQKEELACPNPISVYVEYGLFGSAVEAEVLSVAISDHSVTLVSGSIFARSCMVDPNFKSVIFQGSGEVAQDSHEIALQRSFVAVPRTSYLLIEVKLHDQRGKLIVNGTFPFLSLSTGIFVSAADNIEIRVQWHCEPLHHGYPIPTFDD